MALADFLANLDSLADEAQARFTAAVDAAALEEARVAFLGAKAGKLRQSQKGLGKVPPADKPAAGKRFNEVKTLVEAAFEGAQARLTSGETSSGEAFDVTLPGKARRIGHLHPITQTIRSMKEIMGRLGFTAVEGPEIEDEWHNFEALNIPLVHPARDPLDNFYLGGENAAAEAASPLLLRSQTSTVQIRVMESTPPPVRIISLGRVYRPDTADATHYPMFHQIEGLLVDRGVTMADLKSVLRLFCQSYFGGDNEVHIRFRPSFFPFTEPSVEVDMNWQGGWMEMGGAGMVDPNVLRAVGYDPEEVTGFAFGLGVERVCMRQHGITDIRAIYQNDVRFLEQF
ncbi:phenylalanine--tRNA ligase subunit alpha [Bythopirellula polymerisocia]|uniref:Phenylalanine--tRNA ligase alpha subunit n=1 Tax=Bythopirellula polymerisocia TaxID=2528003 RepID=A0A5C6CTF4_9BACT|nr:phenylalanine--tRNA ligase subunit alpha [Bythopirellula polymerisocia]TWU28223.1 Phenylalanine--tRNA ligase alpha subunit [Bythopirellula polymerisocia]